jgi:hypothetical protein
MAEGERATGTPNTIYDLSSVLFHALEGGASYDTFIEDAEREGDRELVEFFEQVRDEDSNRADRAQQLLTERTTTAERTGGIATGAAPGMEPDDITTMTGTAGVASSPEPSGAPPMSEDVPPAAGEAPPRREDPLGREDALPREERGALGREDPLPREERGALGREDRLPREERASLGREDPLAPEDRASLGREDPIGREEREDPLGREDRLPGEERGALGREDRLPREESARETEREEDKGLLDRALDKLSGRGDEEGRREEERREGPDRRS